MTAEAQAVDGDVPAVVFSGPPSEAIVLVSRLQSEGIEASVEGRFMGISLTGTGRPYVRRSDARLAAIDHLAAMSTELAGDSGPAYDGDERQSIGPQDLFDEQDGRRALEPLEFVAAQCARLPQEISAS